MNFGLLLYLKLARVDVGNVSKKGKIWKVLLLEVFLLVGFLTELCLYIEDWVQSQFEQYFFIFDTLD